MVKNLFKHEIRAYIRIWIPLQLIFLAVAVAGRFMQIFETNNIIYSVIFFSSMTVYAISAFALLTFSQIFPVIRYYRNLFTGEGYLSFTLPVTATAHILVKLCTAVLFYVETLLCVGLSFIIVTSGDMLVEITRAAAYLVGLSKPYIGVHLWLYIIEFIVLMIVSAASQYQLYNTCATVGQLANKGRIALAFGTYFGYYILTQAFTTVFQIIAMFIPEEVWESIFEYFGAHYVSCIHYILCGAILISVASTVVYFFISKFIIKKRLNLQ